MGEEEVVWSSWNLPDDHACPKNILYRKLMSDLKGKAFIIHREKLRLRYKGWLVEGGVLLAWPRSRVSGLWIPILLFEYLKRDAHLEGDGMELDANWTHQNYTWSLRVWMCGGRRDQWAVLLPIFSFSLGWSQRKHKPGRSSHQGKSEWGSLQLESGKSSTSHPPPSPSPGRGWGARGSGALLAVGTGVPRSGNKMGFPLKGLTIFGKTRQTLGVEQNPIYYVLKFHPPGTWREPEPTSSGNSKACATASQLQL